MVTSPASRGAPPLRALRRDAENGVLGGVCAGVARELRIDPLVVRVAFVAAAVAGGLGVVVYALAWVLTPATSGGRMPALGVVGGRRAVEVALGGGLLVLSVLLAFREAGLWFSDALVWPLVLVASGGALIWRASLGAAGRRSGEAAPGDDRGRTGAPQGSDVTAGAAASASARAVVSRAGLGVALVVGAGLAFLQATGALSAARDVLLAALAVAVVLSVIFAPWVLRLARSLASERAERIRSEERAEVAAHLHDSVLQTLALMQKRSDEPREVAALARHQERELRTWLSGRGAGADGEQRLVAALEAVADEVEQRHRVAVDVVAVGDRDLDAAGDAVAAAAREAIVNAAKFGGGSPVAVYVEAADERVQVFVRDRGPGFDPETVPDDRRGVRDSIVGRMARNGGRAAIHRLPSGGTEVELVMERRRP